jgi:hypothetical protein
LWRSLNLWDSTLGMSSHTVATTGHFGKDHYCCYSLPQWLEHEADLQSIQSFGNKYSLNMNHLKSHAMTMSEVSLEGRLKTKYL